MAKHRTVTTKVAAPKPAAPAPAAPIPAFNPYADPGYVALAGSTGNQLADTYTDLGVTFDANGNPVYSGGAYLQGAQNYGLDENGNPIAQGDVRYNPFSKLNMMKQAFEQRKNGTVNSYAANGQLYAGSLLNQQNADAGNYAQGYDALQRNTKGYYGDLVSKAVAARDANNVALAGAGTDALGRFIDAHANDAAPGAAAPAAAKPKSGVARVLGRLRFPAGSRTSNAFGGYHSGLGNYQYK